MSGRDERKETVKMGAVSERINRFTCLHCGSHTWAQWNTYSSRSLYNAESDRGELSGVEYNGSSEWECHDCGTPANAEQLDELCELGID